MAVISKSSDGTFTTNDHGHEVMVKMVDTDTWVTLVNGVPASVPSVTMGAAFSVARRMVRSMPHAHAFRLTGNVHAWECCD